MRAFTASVLLAASIVTTGCYVSHKKEVREVPVAPATTVERHTTVEQVPGDVVHERTTVERAY